MFSLTISIFIPEISVATSLLSLVYEFVYFQPIPFFGDFLLIRKLLLLREIFSQGLPIYQSSPDIFPAYGADIQASEYLLCLR